MIELVQDNIWLCKECMIVACNTNPQSTFKSNLPKKDEVATAKLRAATAKLRAATSRSFTAGERAAIIANEFINLTATNFGNGGVVESTNENVHGDAECCAVCFDRKEGKRYRFAELRFC